MAEAEAVVEIGGTPEVTPTAVYKTEILATLANADVVATPTPEAHW